MTLAKEIERKFLVRREILIPLLDAADHESKTIAQYYLVATPQTAVRIRLVDDARAFLTLKSGGDLLSTNEFEFEVAADEFDARAHERTGIVIEKIRYLVPHAGRVWEVDEFQGDLDGLIVAELEADDAASVTDLPEWVAEEVTYDRRYKNAVLALEGMPREPLDALSLPFKSNGSESELKIMAALHYFIETIDDRSDTTAGMSEGLMYAPGDAVFATGPASERASEEADMPGVSHPSYGLSYLSKETLDEEFAKIEAWLDQRKTQDFKPIYPVSDAEMKGA